MVYDLGGEFCRMSDENDKAENCRRLEQMISGSLEPYAFDNLACPPVTEKMRDLVMDKVTEFLNVVKNRGLMGPRYEARLVSTDEDHRAGYLTYQFWDTLFDRWANLDEVRDDIYVHP